MDGYEDYIVFAIFVANGVHSATTLCKGNVGFFGDEYSGIDTLSPTQRDYILDELAGLFVLSKTSVRRAFAKCVDSMPRIVNFYFDHFIL